MVEMVSLTRVGGASGMIGVLEKNCRDSDEEDICQLLRLQGMKVVGHCEGKDRGLCVVDVAWTDDGIGQ